jgi:DNA-binding response OmpR family regulator
MINNSNNILLLEDDETLGYLLSEYLGMNGFNVSWAKTSVNCLQLLEEKGFDLAILDVMLPDIDGFRLAQKINSSHPNLPFLFLTARSLKVDVLKGFSLGAVDYLKKPIDEEILVVRIKALLNRIKEPSSKYKIDNAFKIGDYLFNPKNQELAYKEDVISLTHRESQLLLFLFKHSNTLCTHKEILIHLWGKNDYFNKKSLNVFVTRLRKYLANDESIKIENVHHRGFIFKIEDY